ncbi:UDP-N-acetylglucosamine transferase subunit alg14 [Zychaea mexicana]|uniref:UDP-N-acetylglucosamine transferase subunit alg14 n=1 Tax=Zychaea mexicana TaxID=64656 RepID=UPI0022FE00AE|nr:UDP-N-acetylglucosamine transferase subunit alg14 [Zychaea mexicana]KAI9495457.1 UDP-N-acetylglucosamine transferase subunit alg14 [Zychaea mexicana]
MFLAAVVVAAATTVALIAMRLWQITPGCHSSKPLNRRESSCRTLIFLGSGGHTAEMMALVSTLNQELYTPRFYLVAESDTLSESKAKAQDAKGAVYRLPRAREVGQSWTKVPISMACALMVSIGLFLQTMPDLILCNGPGSCIPICMAAYLVRILGLRRVQIVYVESFARVTRLSLTGRLLYLFVDRFIVQWPELVQRYPKAEYHGILV